MENNNFIEELPPKKEPTFNSIDEYESYLNDSIKDSLSVFLNFMKDYDIFRKMFSKEAKEAAKRKNLRKQKIRKH